MIYNQNLENIIFSRHTVNNADRLIILSGYVGPTPISNLTNTGLNCTVIYGMYPSASISSSLHQVLTRIDSQHNNISIHYSTITVHSKCYIWLQGDTVVDVLIGSANFSSNGLRTPYRETLADIDTNSYNDLMQYINHILNNSIHCRSGIPSSRNTYPTVQISANNIISPSMANICHMTLLDRSGQVPTGSGLNWGNSNAHVTLGDAYIPIRVEHITNFPDLFPPKQSYPIQSHNGRQQRQNDVIEVIWDDNTFMECLLEGTQSPSGFNEAYPKQLCSSPNKNTLGIYLRNRLGVSLTHIITLQDLNNYGRTDIELSLRNDGTYFANFSV